MTTDCRAQAAKCLSKIQQGASLNQQLPLFESQVEARDKPLLHQLVYGVLRFYPKLFAISEQLISKPLKKKDSDVLMLILLGGYQLEYTRIPDHAAVSATVAATRSIKKAWAKNLVNGVLRQWQRKQSSLQQPLSPAAQSAHPDWFFGKLNKAWPDQAEAILAANNQQAPMCLRVNQQLISRDDYLNQLAASEIAAEPTAYALQGIRLQQACPVEQLPGFYKGLVSVQDEAAQLSAQLLNLQPEQTVLDACCAPGGKSCHILETELGLKELIALDVDNERLAKVQQNLDRLNLQATLLQGDASQPEAWRSEKTFDRILLDVPCSATGVIRRNPDIKLHRKPEDIKALAELQLSILQALWPTLKAGGELVYATCSVLPDENEKVVAKFCNQSEDTEHIAIMADWGEQRPFGRQLFPQNQGHDGFYYAKLKKTV